MHDSFNKTTNNEELNSINRKVEVLFQKLQSQLLDQERYLVTTPLYMLKKMGLYTKKEWIYQATKALEALSA
jgi:hypothetical protein